MAGADEQTGKVLESQSNDNPPTPQPGPGVFIPIHQTFDEASLRANSKKPPPNLLLILGFAILAAAGISFYVVKRPPSATTASSFQDLKAGISNATGLKGNLQVRWQGETQYQLKIEPIDPLENADFAYVTAYPPSPLSINVRLLDASGFAVCGKEIVFRFNPAAAATPAPSAHATKASEAEKAALSAESNAQRTEQDRERGMDFFQNILGEDGKVTAVTSQGVLPCTADQYKQISYWDFSTNFPTRDEQDALMKNTAATRARLAAEEAARKKNSKFGIGFYAEGDDTVSGYDSSRGVLESRLGRNYLVPKASDRAASSAWAANDALFHYKCDQRARCALTHAGGGETIYVIALQ